MLIIFPCLLAAKCGIPYLLLEKDGAVELLDGDATTEEVTAEDGRWPVSTDLKMDLAGNPESIGLDRGVFSMIDD